jgi:hypothetical protein
VNRAFPVVVAVAMVGFGVFLLTRPSPDVDHLGSYGTIGWGGAHALDEADAPREHYAGKGTVVAAAGARTLRDHPVKLTVAKDAQAQLARFGIRAEVRFVTLDFKHGYGDYTSDGDLDRGSATMPANADGELVHVFHVDRCLPANSSIPATFAVEGDGHPLRVTGDRDELWTYERAIRTSYGELDLGAC